VLRKACDGATTDFPVRLRRRTRLHPRRSRCVFCDPLVEGPFAFPALSSRPTTQTHSLDRRARRRTKGTLLIVAARCPVCGEPVCLDRSTYQNNYEYPLRLPTNEITRTTGPGSLVYKPNNLTGHQASIGLILVSASPALMATFTASSIGSLKGTSIRSRPCS